VNWSHADWNWRNMRDPDGCTAHMWRNHHMCVEIALVTRW